MSRKDNLTHMIKMLEEITWKIETYKDSHIIIDKPISLKWINESFISIENIKDKLGGILLELLSYEEHD